MPPERWVTHGGNHRLDGRTVAAFRSDFNQLPSKMNGITMAHTIFTESAPRSSPDTGSDNPLIARIVEQPLTPAEAAPLSAHEAQGVFFAERNNALAHLTPKQMWHDCIWLSDEDANTKIMLLCIG